MVVGTCIPSMCGKKLRASFAKPSPNYPKGKVKNLNVRVVPAFTIQSLQKNTIVLPPPKCNVFAPVKPKQTLFIKCYQKGEFPVSIGFGPKGKTIVWKTPIEDLDFHRYLPMFFDGLAEGTYPYSFIIEKGLDELIRKGSYKVLPVVPQLIIPIKNALATKMPDVICHCLKCVQILVEGCDGVGEALVPYYRQILPIFNLFYNKFRDHMQPEKREENVGDMIEDTLQILERFGGPDAFINIKYMIPPYESCVMN